MTEQEHSHSNQLEYILDWDMTGEDTEKWSTTQNLHYHEASFSDIRVIGIGFQNASEDPPVWFKWKQREMLTWEETVLIL